MWVSKGNATNNNLKKTLHGATFGQGLLINEIKNGGHHTRSEDVHHTILEHFYITFNGKMIVSVIKMISVIKLPTIFFNNSAWN